MKKYLIFLIIVASTYSCSKKNKLQDIHYVSEDKKMEFIYNKNWNFKEVEIPNIELLLVHITDKDKSSSFKNINLAIMQKNSDLNFDEHIRGNKNYLLMNNHKIVSEKIISHNNKEVYRVIWDQVAGKITYRTIQYLMLIDNKGYTLSFNSIKNEFDKFSEEAEDIIRSFKFN